MQRTTETTATTTTTKKKQQKEIDFWAEQMMTFLLTHFFHRKNFTHFFPFSSLSSSSSSSLCESRNFIIDFYTLWNRLLLRILMEFHKFFRIRCWRDPFTIDLFQVMIWFVQFGRAANTHAHSQSHKLENSITEKLTKIISLPLKTYQCILSVLHACLSGGNDESRSNRDTRHCHQIHWIEAIVGKYFTIIQNQQQQH